MPLSGTYNYAINNGNTSQPAKGVGLYDGTTNLELDDSGFVTIVESGHHRVHEADLYTVSDYVADIDIAQPKYYLLQTPSNAPYAHVTFNVEASGEVKIEFYESGSYPQSGSQVVGVNHNRVSGSTDGLLVWASSSYDGTNTGSLLQVNLLGGNQNVARVGGVLRSEEYILAANTDYLLKLTVASDNTRLNTQIVYYMSSVAS